MQKSKTVQIFKHTYSWLSIGMASGFGICAIGFVLVQILYK
jgi:hypothetical protein